VNVQEEGADSGVFSLNERKKSDVFYEMDKAEKGRG